MLSAVDSGWSISALLRKAAVLGLLIVVIGRSSPVLALTGDELLRQCSTAADALGRKRCESYIDGVVSGINTLTISMKILHPESNGYPQLFCVPRFTATKDLVTATVSYLKQHAGGPRYDASSEILLALEQAYPCKGG